LIKKTLSGSRDASSGSHWEPNTDVYLAENRLIINVELAGMRREDLELCVDGNRLIITGQRPDCGRPAGGSFMVMEINYGPFSGDLCEAVAGYQNGFLKIEVPQSLRPASGRQMIPLSELK
jgi:HSP20 family protein